MKVNNIAGSTIHKKHTMQTIPGTVFDAFISLIYIHQKDFRQKTDWDSHKKFVQKWQLKTQ